MTLETHHQATLIETAKLELDRAHRAARSLDAGEIRRGLEIALTSLREATVPVVGAPEPAVPHTAMLYRLVATLERALADLQNGQLAELGQLIEAARKDLEG